MTAAEIRKFFTETSEQLSKATSLSEIEHGTQVVSAAALSEIAAQLAELNHFAERIAVALEQGGAR